MVLPINHAKQVINTVSVKTNRVILFFSAGKDSLAMLDLMAPKFEKIYLVFMYFVKDLEHVNKFLRWAESKYPNVEVLQVPHWTLTAVYRSGHYCTPNPKIKLLKLADVDAAIRLKTGCQWTFYGMKQSDSLNRRLMLRTYEDEAISPTQKVFPLSRWKKKDVLQYLKLKGLPEPINYGSTKSSVGLGFNAEVFAWLRNNYPADLEKIYEAFPLSRVILYEYDNKISSSKRNNLTI